METQTKEEFQEWKIDKLKTSVEMLNETVTILTNRILVLERQFREHMHTVPVSSPNSDYDMRQTSVPTIYFK